MEQSMSTREENRPPDMPLLYFEDVLALEFAAIEKRRARRPNSLNRKPIARNLPEPSEAEAGAAPLVRGSGRSAKPSPDPRELFRRAAEIGAESGRGAPLFPAPRRADPVRPDADKQRPIPVPCDATGLAFSGGGIRSAAVCLGAVQALHNAGRLRSFDYLSTVSGGGYIGASLSAALWASRATAPEHFPYGDGVADGPAVAHLRDYSNYLLPRSQGFLRNLVEATSILLRGLLANLAPVLATLLGLALLTRLAYPTFDSLRAGSFAPSLIEGLSLRSLSLNAYVGARPFALTLWLLGVTSLALICWALWRSILLSGWRSAPGRDELASDGASPVLVVASCLVAATAASAALDFQPVAIAALAGAVKMTAPAGGGFLQRALTSLFSVFSDHNWVGGLLTAFAAATSYLSRALGIFLKVTQHATDRSTLAKRFMAQAALVVAAMVLPFVLWAAYLALSVGAISWWTEPAGLASGAWLLIAAFILLATVAFFLQANAYSLHRLYRDRLSRAFLFWRGPPREQSAPNRLDDLKLSALRDGAGPYHLINAALNVQGSATANQRGRNADFFIFTQDFVGSDLTMYAPTKARDSMLGMEDVDPALNLATAMAISGAAVSANMGASTIRLMSPTLALLNFRLGYWLRNPRDFAKTAGRTNLLLACWRVMTDRFYLLVEMLNLLNESSRHIYLTDGGHIENLGAYELLKRGCKLILVIDAEADPAMSFGALQKLERYARIDFGVRISLPWESIAARTIAFDAETTAGPGAVAAGPHCAVGRINYADGAQGVLVYFKSSLTGDEKDYILDYKKRYPAFPHETTGDQFFSEEQFECYRALGFHMVDHFFDRADDFSPLTEGRGAFASRDDAFAAIDEALPRLIRDCRAKGAGAAEIKAEPAEAV
jgi:hypothetical protein